MKKLNVIAKKLKENHVLIGLGFTIVSAVFVIVLSDPFLKEARLRDFMYDAGVDSMGALFSAALFYGCMRQKGEGSSAFRALILLSSACFAPRWTPLRRMRRSLTT